MDCKRILTFLLLPALLVLSGTGCQGEARRTGEEAFTVTRGLNISHWLSQSQVRGAARVRYFTEKDVEYIASEGFDHVRIPVDEEQLFHEDGSKDAEAFALLHEALGWCRENGLRAIVDLHILRSHHFNAAEKPLFTEPQAQERFYDCWRAISGELKGYSNAWVAYELMNEPVADEPEQWNRLVKRCVEVIREREPERTLVIGSNLWQSFRTMKDLSVPEGDPNIILSFHYYDPFLLTHYRAGWTDQRDFAGAVHYPGRVVEPEDLAALPAEQAAKYAGWADRIYDKNAFARDFSEALAVARKYGLQLYCGEYGCINSSPVRDRLRWWRDINEVFDEMGIARAVWDYKGDFGILKREWPDRPMLDALMGKPVNPTINF